MSLPRLDVALMVGWILDSEEVLRASKKANVEVNLDPRIDDPADIDDLADALAIHLGCVFVTYESGDGESFGFGPDFETGDDASARLSDVVALTPRLAQLSDDLRALGIDVDSKGGARIFVSFREAQEETT